MTALLADIRVLDLSRYVAGPMCGALLADLGADVIRIEPPGGAEDRHVFPLDADYSGGAGFQQVNRNKRGLTLDLTRPSGRVVFNRLLLSADCVITNMPHESAVRMQLDYEHLAAVKPSVILINVNAFGNHGPLANRIGFDAMGQVMSGATYLSGTKDSPMKSAAAWVDMASGFICAFGAMAALRHRDRTGQGQDVAVNLLRTALTVTNYFLIEEAFNGLNRSGTGNRAQSGGPADLVKTKDGWIYIATLGNPMFRRWARLVGAESRLTSDDRFKDDHSRADAGEELSAIAKEWAKDKTTAQALTALEAARVPAAPLLSPRQILHNEEIDAAALFESIRIPGLPKPVPLVRPPAEFSLTPAAIRTGAPRAGEHTDDILREVSFSDSDIAALRETGVV